MRPEAALAQLQIAELLLAASEERAASGEGEAAQQEADALRAEGERLLDAATAEVRALRMQPALQRALRQKGLLKA